MRARPEETDESLPHYLLIEFRQLAYPMFPPIELPTSALYGRSLGGSVKWDEANPREPFEPSLSQTIIFAGEGRTIE